MENFYGAKVKRWDAYFHKVCEAVASKSPCLSRKIGAILVNDSSIVSTGFNGPARGIPHCGRSRFEKDESISFIPDLDVFKTIYTVEDIISTCPRKLMGFPSGTGMEWCTAQHAEENAVSNAARQGVVTFGSILYMNCVIPCNKCFGTLINAGIVEIVVDSIKTYDDTTSFLINHSKIKIREFSHGKKDSTKT